MIQPRFLPAAESEFLAEVAFYSSARSGLGMRFQAAVEIAMTRAIEQPSSGTAGTRSTRRLPVRGFPFFLIYRSDGDELLVVAVAHQSRRPGYWVSRLK